MNLLFLCWILIANFNSRWKSVRQKCELQSRHNDNAISIQQRYDTVSTIYILGLVLCIHEIGTRWSLWTMGWWVHHWFHSKESCWRNAAELPARHVFVAFLGQRARCVCFLLWLIVTTSFFSKNCSYVSLGGITIAWVAQKPNQMPHIVMLKPFEHKDLGMRSLADRINDLDQCVYLYPDIPKETAFEKYYTKVDGKTKLVLTTVFYYGNFKELTIWFLIE